MRNRKQPVVSDSISAIGKTLVIHEWKGSGPDYMHVHHKDDEAWHVLEGRLTFKFSDHVIEAAKGKTVFVPAGVVHSYSADQDARYLIILTPRLHELIAELHRTPYAQHGDVMKKYDSEIVK